MSNLKQLTKDLSKQAPRSPAFRLGNYAYMARMIDKGRADIAGQAGEYHFACPADQYLLTFKDVQADAVKAKLATGATDEEFLAWFEGQGTPKTKQEILEWSKGAEDFSMYNTPGRDQFVAECKKLGLNAETTTLVQWLEKDDAVSFAQKN
ncbi:MAG TPA: DUF5069 domain-containing protein [Candidatus Methylacidiphilales bacterium]